MRVHQLIEALGEFAPELEVVVVQHSDFVVATLPIGTVDGVEKSWGVMGVPRGYGQRLSLKDRERVKQYLLIG